MEDDVCELFADDEAPPEISSLAPLESLVSKPMKSRLGTSKKKSREARGGVKEGGESPVAFVINGMKFSPFPGVRYRIDWRMLAEKLTPENELLLYRECILKDLWFFVYFVMKWPGAHHKFIVEACNEIEEGPQSLTLDTWFREGGKTTVITQARSIQEVLRNPNETVCIMSYALKPATAILASIREMLVQSDFLKACFPDVLYQAPEKESPKWSLQEGLTVKRSSFLKESTFEAHGLIDGMPTGKHFSLIVYDDIVTSDLINTPEIIEKVKDRFDMSMNLGTAQGRHRVVGTYYHHEDPLVYIRGKKRRDGTLAYCERRKPATIDGTIDGASIFLPEERLELFRMNPKIFYTQQLLDPTPSGSQVLDFNKIKIVHQDVIPKDLHKFIVIDPAGTSAGKDAWACWCVGVSGTMADLWGCNLYVIDGFLEPLEMDEAMRKIVLCYTNNGHIRALGIEKVGMSSMEIHVANALMSHGKRISVENKTLVVLNPSGRKKAIRIEQSLMLPMNDGRIHISSKVKQEYVNRLRSEMDRFPAWHDDGIDALAYSYDMIKELRFSLSQGVLKEQEDRWSHLFNQKDEENRRKYEQNWMTV